MKTSTILWFLFFGGIFIASCQKNYDDYNPDYVEYAPLLKNQLKSVNTVVKDSVKFLIKEAVDYSISRHSASSVDYLHYVIDNEHFFNLFDYCNNNEGAIYVIAEKVCSKNSGGDIKLFFGVIFYSLLGSMDLDNFFTPIGDQWIYYPETIELQRFTDDTTLLLDKLLL